MAQSITTDRGTTVSTEENVTGTLVLLNHPKAPADMKDIEAGRIVDGGFQPAVISVFAMSPAVLRAIADLIEGA